MPNLNVALQEYERQFFRNLGSFFWNAAYFDITNCTHTSFKHNCLQPSIGFSIGEKICIISASTQPFFAWGGGGGGDAVWICMTEGFSDSQFFFTC